MRTTKKCPHCGNKLGRGSHKCRTCASKENISKLIEKNGYKPYTTAQKEMLIHLYGTMPNRLLSALLGRTVNSVKNKAYEMGLGKKHTQFCHRCFNVLAPALGGLPSKTVDGVMYCVFCAARIEVERKEQQEVS